jgi:hypothetical protein
MRETWLVLEDDEVVDPAEVSADETGRLVHSSGVPVAIRAGVPRSRGVDDPDAARAAAAQEREAMKAAAAKEKAAKPAADPVTKEAPETAPEPPKSTREMAADKPKRGGSYKTRGAKAD